MAFHSPRQSQNYYEFNPSTPPPPPPKPSAHSSGTATPQTGPPLPPPPHSSQHSSSQPYAPGSQPQPRRPPVSPPDDGWLPDVLKDKAYVTVRMRHVGC
jgi:hypothetical protein